MWIGPVTVHLSNVFRLSFFLDFNVFGGLPRGWDAPGLGDQKTKKNCLLKNEIELAPLTRTIRKRKARRADLNDCNISQIKHCTGRKS